MFDRLLLVVVSRYQFQNLTLAEAVLVLTGMDTAVRWLLGSGSLRYMTEPLPSVQ